MEETVNVLLVDDQPEGLLSLEAILQGLNQNLVKAHSGREALRQLLDTDFALILLDVQMPEMDGYETAEAIRQRDRSRHTPIIFLTAAHRTEAHVFEGYSKGAVDYMFKPIEPEILRSKVRVFIDLAHQTQEVQRLNALLMKQAAQLAASNQDLEAFARSVSHDLRGPVRAIQGYGRSLTEGSGEALTADGRQHLKRIAAAAERMSALIEDLLALARVTYTEVRRSAVDLGAQARIVADALAATAPGREVDWVIADALSARADPGLLRIVIENLLGNGWKYSRTRAKARIEVGAVRGPEGGPAFFVRDNGVGFDMRHVDQLFFPFHRLHPAEEFEGTGVGLATVHRIIERHGGRIWAESALGEGATFYFTLE